MLDFRKSLKKAFQLYEHRDIGNGNERHAKNFYIYSCKQAIEWIDHASYLTNVGGMVGGTIENGL